METTWLVFAKVVELFKWQAPWALGLSLTIANRDRVSLDATQVVGQKVDSLGLR